MPKVVIGRVRTRDRNNWYLPEDDVYDAESGEELVVLGRRPAPVSGALAVPGKITVTHEVSDIAASKLRELSTSLVQKLVMGALVVLLIAAAAAWFAKSQGYFAAPPAPRRRRKAAKS